MAWSHVYVGNSSRLSNRLWMRYETVQQVMFFLVIDLIRLNSIWFMNYGSSLLLQQFVWCVKVFERSDKLWFITTAEFAFSTKPILNAMLSSADSTRFVSLALLNPFDKFIFVFRFRIITKLVLRNKYKQFIGRPEPHKYQLPSLPYTVLIKSAVKRRSTPRLFVWTYYKRCTAFWTVALVC